MNRFIHLSLVTISLAVIAACPADGHEPVESVDETADAPVATAENGPQATLASRATVESDCDDGKPQLQKPLRPDALCDWASSADLVVWGTVDNVRDMDAPLARAGTAIPPAHRKWELAEGCDTEIEPTLAFDLSKKGTLKGEAAERVTVHMGLQQAAQLRALDKSAKGALTEGEIIGVALHWLEGFDAWSLMGEPLVRLDDEGKTFVQGPINNRRPLRKISDVEDLTFAELQRKVAQCATTDGGIGRRERLVREWGPDNRKRNKPTKYIAAWCRTDHNRKLPAGTCYSDFDCEEQEGTICDECAGRCKVVGEGYCLADVDCATGERCNRCTGECSPKVR